MENLTKQAKYDQAIEQDVRKEGRKTVPLMLFYFLIRKYFFFTFMSLKKYLMVDNI